MDASPTFRLDVCSGSHQPCSISYVGKCNILKRQKISVLAEIGTLTDTARRVMERSAEQAGFYEAGRDRLVMPGFVPSESLPAEASGEMNGSGSGTGKREW